MKEFWEQEHQLKLLLVDTGKEGAGISHTHCSGNSKQILVYKLYETVEIVDGFLQWYNLVPMNVDKGEVVRIDILLYCLIRSKQNQSPSSIRESKLNSYSLAYLIFWCPYIYH